MPKLLDMMFLNRCAHEFSWPRRSQTGECYQVCLICGDQYGYDWKKMHRLERLAVPVEVSNGRVEKTAKWLPRARRLHISVPIRYREVGGPEWHEGEIQNISESGVFVAGAASFREKVLVEMIFEMPVQISGKKRSAVLCNGRVTRTKTQGQGMKPGFAVGIMACQYLHEDLPAANPSIKKVKVMAVTALVKSVRCRSKKS